MKQRSTFVKFACALVLTAGYAAHAQDTQTFQVGNDNAKSPQAKTQQKQNQAQGQPQLGWGTNIQNARIGRAAEIALQKGDKAQALDLARRAVHAAPNDPQLWFLVGYAARLNNRFSESVEAYQHGLSLKSTLDGTSGLAQDYMIMGRTADAQRLLKEVIAADPRRRDDVLMLGESYMRARDFQTALPYLTRAEQLHPDARSEVLLAITYEQLKRMDVANRYLDMARHRDPGNPDVERALAGYYREVGKYEDAINALKAIRNPRPDVVAELAYTYQLDGKLNLAAQLFAKAADAQPKDLALQLSAAQAAVTISSLDGANHYLDRAKNIDPNYYRLHAIRGEVFRIQDRSDDSIAEYKQAIANLPGEVAEGPLYPIQLHVNLMQLYNAVNDKGSEHQQLQIAQQQIGALDEQGAAREPFLRLRSLIKLAAGNPDGALGDIKEALALNPHSRENLQQDGDVLVKLGRIPDAIEVYKQVLAMDPDDRLALTSLGYASREAGHLDEAENYFKRLAKIEPGSYLPYLALGDLYAARREFSQGQAAYSKAYGLSPNHALVVAGGINVGIESHNLNLAGQWFNRVTDSMVTEPQILREQERYLSFMGEYPRSEQVARKAIQVLPNDRDVVVYLGYDLLNLHRYQELLDLAAKYNDVLSQEPDIPLLAGYVHKHNNQEEEARRDFSEAIERDPKATTAYVNRGYMLNDLHQPEAAASDFETALKLEPHNGEAHLGAGFSYLDLRRYSAAIRNADIAEKEMGDLLAVHVIRANAYGNLDMLGKAAQEFRAALKFAPDDPTLHFGLGNVYFAERRYHPAIDELLIAAKLSPANAQIDATLARSYAFLDDRPNTMQYIELAERNAAATPTPRIPWGEPLLASIYVTTGQALNTLGDQAAAMDRFTKALNIPGSNRLSVRLAIAQTMESEGHQDDAQRQIALGLMEAGTGETAPPSGGQFIQAADVFRSMHDYDLSQGYLDRARKAGASDTAVRIGMANNYLAVGDTMRAKAELDAVRAASNGDPDYQFLIAQANVFRQEHLGAQALTSFAQASNAEGEDQTAQEGLLETGAEEGWSVNPHVSLLSDLAVTPLYEDTTVYVLDAKTIGTPPPGNTTNTALLPPPRSSIQTQWTAAYKLHYNFLPPSGGFFQLRNARGQISEPATNAIENRDTTDYTFNYGVDPTFRLGLSSLTLNSGIQATVRRDSLVPQQMNQNLLREYTFISSSSFFDVLSFSGYIIHEHGPFTQLNLNSHQLTGALDFRIGSPWGNTALVTGWGYSDLKFNPENYEDYLQSAYIGLEHRFGTRLNVRAMVEDLRAWRVFNSSSGIAQNLRPAGMVDYTFKKNWDFQFSSSYSSTRSFHVYDATQNGFSVSYAKPFRRRMTDAGGPVTYAYPLRFSAGFQDESFFNFNGGHSQQLRPYFGITIF